MLDPSLYRVSPFQPNGSDEQAQTTPALKTYPLEEFVRLNLPQRELVLSPVLSVSSLAMLVAYRGVGKTQVALRAHLRRQLRVEVLTLARAEAETDVVRRRRDARSAAPRTSPGHDGGFARATAGWLLQHFAHGRAGPRDDPQPRPS